MATKISGTGFKELVVDNLVLTTPLAEQYGGSGSTGVYKMEYASPKSATGTFVDFGGIPSWAKRITILLSGISTNGSSNPLIQIGYSGGIENTGYGASSVAPITGAATVGANYTTGFGIASNSASAILSGTMTLVNITGNEWCSSHSTGFNTTNAASLGGGNKTLSATLDRVRITTVNGTDLFDAGTINVMWEGFA